MSCFFLMNDHLIYYAPKKTNKSTLPPTHTWIMEIGLILAVSLLTLVAFVGGSLDDVKKMIHSTDALTSAAVGTEASLVKCTLQGTARLPAFSMDGDFVIGGAFFIHYQMHTVVNNYTTKPELPRCTGRLVRGRSVASFAIICREKYSFKKIQAAVD